MLQLNHSLANIIQTHPEKFFAEIYLVHSHPKKLLLEFVFQCRSVIGFDYRMNIKFKWHTCTAKFINPFLRGSSCKPDFVNAFPKDPTLEII